MTATRTARPKFSARASAEFVARNGFPPDQAAGLVQLRFAQDTGRLVGLYRAAEAGIESDADAGSWATVCEDHATCVLHDTVELGKAHAAAPLGWCGTCRGDDA
jgi:hypothetical protein